jgi:AAA family ATP:ADP antiporter
MAGFFNAHKAVQRGEWWPVLCAAATFFCILASYYVLRPVRDEMAVRLGAEQLKWLFTATFVTMFCAVPLFGFAAARVRRAVLVAGTLLFFATHLLVFRVALQDADLAQRTAAVMFVWVSVFNLFVVSLFWSLMADVFDLEQAERLFGPIAVGGTTGALAGPLITALAARELGVPNLLLVSAGLLVIAAAAVGVLSRFATRLPHARPAPQGGLGGSAWQGLSLVLRSPFLLLFSLYLLLHSVAGTVLYFEQTRIVKETFASSEARTAFFAQVDLAVNVLTVLTQLLGLAPLVRRFGLGIALALLPALTALGFLALGTWPTLAVLVAFGVTRRAGEYAIARPAREMLFTVLPRAVKYKAKNFLDTVVFRGSDAVSSWLVDALRAGGVVGGVLAFAAVPTALLGLAVGLRLGRPQTPDSTKEHTSHDPASPTPLAHTHSGDGSHSTRR